MKTYIAEYPDINWRMEVEINDDQPTTMQVIKESIEFWDEPRTWDDDDTMIERFMELLASRVSEIAYSNGGGAILAIAFMKQLEGWPSLGGEWGIKITQVDSVDLGTVIVSEEK